MRTPLLLALLLTAGAAGCRRHQELPVSASAGAPTRWVAPGSLQAGPIVHPELSPDQVARIRRLRETFGEFDPSPLEKWVEDFQRDHDPENELRIYEGMAEAYRAYCAGRELSREERRDVYQLVLLRSGAPDAEVLARVKLTALSPEQAREVLRGYKAPPSPIKVTQ